MLNLSCLLLLFCLIPPLLPSLQSLTSLFYGEQSEKEKSPSESSPLDADNKDVVSASVLAVGTWAGLVRAQPVLFFIRNPAQKCEKLKLLLNSLQQWVIPGSWRVFFVLNYLRHLFWLAVWSGCSCWQVSHSCMAVLAAVGI